MKHVRDVLVHKGSEVACVSVDASVLDAATLMNERRIGSVVVTDGDQVVGIFTERDILTRIVAAKKDPASTSVADVMTAPCMVVTPSDRLSHCQAVMTQRRIRHIPVVGEDGLVGIVSSGDVLASEMVELETTIKHLNDYIYG
ncbi:MAG: CBS domain-containing protein [Armatimonadetes bacterium]|nr:CBS domain-containing protein [Armatimonadota bacterium]